MIVNRWVFRDDYSTDILHRNPELEQLSLRLRPALAGLKAQNALIWGPSGVGKTASSQFLLRQINQQQSINSATIGCSGKTCHGVVYDAISRHPTAAIVHPNVSMDELLKTLRQIVDEPYVIVLDEADTLPNLDCLPELLSVHDISVIAITHDAAEWLSRLPTSVAETFHGEGEVEFEKYSTQELVDILKPRAEHGLEREVVSDGQLEWIADETAGVARYGIKSLLAAAEIADDRGHDRIHERDISDCFEEAKRMMRKSNLRSLPPVYQMMYEIVRGYGETGVKTTELKGVYKDYCDEIFDGLPQDPVSWARVRDYLIKLEDYDLIEIDGATSGQRYWAKDTELEAPLPVEISKAV